MAVYGTPIQMTATIGNGDGVDPIGVDDRKAFDESWGQTPRAVAMPKLND